MQKMRGWLHDTAIPDCEFDMSSSNKPPLSHLRSGPPPWAALLLGFAFAAQPASAGEAQSHETQLILDGTAVGSDAFRDRVEFVMGNIEFVLIHEFAHLAISELDIPIVGPVEPAADYVATIALIRPRGTPPIDPERWREFAIDAADAFVIAWQFYANSDADMPYWDSHTLTIQRFFTMVCLMYGSKLQQFADLPSRVDMPPDKAQGCVYEFDRAARAIDKTLEAYGRGNGEPLFEQIEIRFDTPRSLASQYILEDIKDSGLLEWTAGRFVELIPLQEPATIVMRNCSRAEAAWLPEIRELVICYELLDVYYLLSRSQNRESIASQ